MTGDDRRAVAVCERASRPCVNCGTDQAAAMHETDAEVALRDHRPRAPGIEAPMDVHDLEDRTVVEAERAPAHVAGGMCP
jgi:hypothetical protein